MIQLIDRNFTCSLVQNFLLFYLGIGQAQIHAAIGRSFVWNGGKFAFHHLQRPWNTWSLCLPLFCLPNAKCCLFPFLPSTPIQSPHVPSHFIPNGICVCVFSGRLVACRDVQGRPKKRIHTTQTKRGKVVSFKNVLDRRVFSLFVCHAFVNNLNLNKQARKQRNGSSRIIHSLSRSYNVVVCCLLMQSGRRLGVRCHLNTIITTIFIWKSLPTWPSNKNQAMAAAAAATGSSVHHHHHHHHHLRHAVCPL